MRLRDFLTAEGT